MCGIFAYLNYDTPQQRKTVINYLLQGLRRLEYRGYDSAGFSIDSVDGTKPEVVRKQGNINALEKHSNSLNIADDVVDNHIGIAHTRWATHGVPSDINSHPHRSDPNNEFVVVHNGIITNYRELKDKLVKKGFVFESETDTEAIPKLCKYFYDKNPTVSFTKLMTRVTNCLQGAFALIVKSSRFPGECVAVKRGSPMILGIKLPEQVEGAASPSVKVNNPHHTDSLLAVPFSASEKHEGHVQAEYFIASDSTAIVDHTKLVIMLQDNDLLHFKNGQYWYYNTTEENVKDRLLETLDIEMGQIDKGGHKHFMSKEIFEQSETVVNTMRGRLNAEKMKIKLGGIENFVSDIRNSRRIIFIACGTSYHSAVATRPLVEELTGIPVTLELASDFLDRRPKVLRNDTCIFISQSGETADSLMALKYCKAAHALCVGITNTVGSAIARETDCGIYLMCGPEIGVASTKAYTSQIIAITLMALKVGDERVSTTERRNEIIAGLAELPKLVTKTLETAQVVKDIASKIYTKKSLLVMGRGYHYGTALEGALKIKEISYMHCEGVLSGELKHGPLALVDDSMPIFFILTKDKNYESTLSSFQQVTARKGQPIIMCTEGDTNSRFSSFPKIEVPKTVDCLQCVLNIIPLQLLSYHVADMKEIDVDRPRNLAKSVTTL